MFLLQNLGTFSFYSEGLEIRKKGIDIRVRWSIDDNCKKELTMQLCEMGGKNISFRIPTKIFLNFLIKNCYALSTFSLQRNGD